MNDIELWFGDSVEQMKRIESQSVDMIFADLPFGTTQNKWDIIIPFNLLWEQYKRIRKKNCAIVLFAQTPFDKLLGASNIEELKYEWIWEKPKATGFLNAKLYPLKAHENILVFCDGVHLYNPQKTQGKPYNKGKPKKNDSGNGTYGNFGDHQRINKTGERLPRTVIKFPTASGGGNTRLRKSYHPNQKPVELLEYMIKTYTNEGMLVVDNTMGSGSTGIACRNLCRRFIGIDNDENYFKTAKERIFGQN